MTRSNPDLINPNLPKKKVKKPLTFPWWCKIIAYGLAFIFSGVSIFFIIMQGITFGNDTVGRWLTSLVVSIFTSIFLTQPIQIALVALFFVTIFRKHDDKADLENDNDDDGKPINSKYKYVKRAGDEEFTSSSNLLRQHGYEKLDEEELEEARIARIKEVKIWKLIREIAAYSMFIWVLAIVAYGNKDINSYFYNNELRSVLSGDKFDDITTPADVWNWTSNVFVPSLTSGDTYYNTNATGLSNYFSDYSSYILSYAIMRQIRVENNSCGLLGSVQSTVDFCLADLGLFNEEKSNFSYGWSQYSASYVESNSALANVYPAFQYTHSSDIDGYPYSGIYNTYQGGGHVYKMLGSQSSILADLDTLKQNNWIDRQTRAVFFEFSLYNPNINLFAFCNVLFEFLPSGVILPSIRISPINLYTFDGSFSSLTIACDIIYLGFIVYFMFREIKEMVKLKCAYFKRFWSYIEWIIIGFSWAAFAMYLYRMYCAQKINDLMKSYNSASSTSQVYIRLQLIGYWNDALGFCLGFCAAMGSMKFLKLLRFNKRIAVFVDAMKLLVVELLGFLFMFMIFYLAFVQLLYLTLNTETLGFSTFVKSMETCFQIMLGKFSVQPIVEANVILGPLYFSFFNIMMVLILLNIFLTIVNNAFAQVRAELNDKKDELDVIGYLSKEIKNLLPFTENQVEDGRSQQDRENARYKDNISYFPQKVDDLLNLLSQIYRQETKH